METGRYHKLCKFSYFNRAIRQSKFQSYVYLNNPKSACSSIKQNLHMYEYRQGNIDSLPSTGKQLHSKERIFAENWNLEDPQQWFIFSFVRNPFVRLLSAYLDKIVRALPPKKHLSKIMGFSVQQNISFDEFIDMVSNLSPEQDDRHWGIQSENILISSIPIHFLGYVEYINSDLNLLWENFFREPSYQFTSWRRHHTDAKELLQQYYTKTSERLVLSKYERDFVNFGYGDNINYIEPIRLSRSFSMSESMAFVLSAYSLANYGMKRKAINKLYQAEILFPEYRKLYKSCLGEISNFNKKPIRSPSGSLHINLNAIKQNLKNSKIVLHKHQKHLCM